ncbi:MAG: DUF1015 domain-containing protein [Candidatus Limiplasma sp.]|nr:DUF1015 domain-containing protein [Candidatus Limiplasma sp.]
MQDLFIRTGELLIPAPDVDPTAWACVACDQYTSQPEYWHEVEALVGDRPSTLRLVLPEIYLDQAAQRIPAIHQAMLDALAQGWLVPGVRDGFILTERSTGSGDRLGLVVLLDLEGYDYRPGSRTPVRATEGTIEDRIPPRLAVRRGAALELSHVLLLADDPHQTVLEPLLARSDTLPLLYDFPLMQGGGHVRGYAVQGADAVAVLAALRALWERHPGGMLLAVGDGNHSLATAKAAWEERKAHLTQAEQADDPARYAMVEIVNIHDDALTFEPIHRVLFHVDGDALLTDWRAHAQGADYSLVCDAAGQPVELVYGGKAVPLSICGSGAPLAVGALQTFLDTWLPAHPDARLDYVHGADTARALAQQPDTAAFLLPVFPKGQLFPAVEALGVLPRKTFSMGEAHEKRYYLEARRLQR